MILDFKSNLVLVIMSVILAAILGVYLYTNADGTNLWTLIVLGLIYLIITWMQLRRNSQRMVQQLEMVLMIQLNVQDYEAAYEKFVQDGSKYSPVWNVTKRQRLAIAYLLNGKEEEAQALIDTLEKEYDVYLNTDFYSAYLLSVIKTLKAAIYDSPKALKSTLKQEQTAFDALPEKIQTQLKDNPSGFHVVLHELAKRLDEDDVTWVDEKTPFIQNVLKLILSQQKNADLTSTFQAEAPS